MSDDECKCPPAGAPAWMATFSDLCTLLLTFFVLLLSFANMDVIKFQDMAGSMKDAFGYRQENFGNFHPELLARKSKVLSALDEVKTGGPLKTQRKMERKVRDLIKRQKAEKKVESESTENGFVIRVNDSVMFTGGKARLVPKGFPILDELAKLFEEFPCDMVIQGHTDDRPVRGRRFDSNWELSASRAISVMRYMVENGGIDPKRLGTAGYADQRPLVPNDSRENRAKNRRVEFLCQRFTPKKTLVYQTDKDGEVKGTAATGDEGLSVHDSADKVLEEPVEDGNEDAEDGDEATEGDSEESGEESGEESEE